MAGINMNMRKKLKRQKKNGHGKSGIILTLLSIIFSISLIFTLIIANYEAIAFNPDYYEKEFSKWGVYSAFESRGISKEELDFKTLQTLVFLRGGGELPSDFFLPDEESHMNDVKNVMRIIDVLWNALIALFISSFIAITGIFKADGIRKAARIFTKTALAMGAILGLFGILMLFKINFESVFFLFHKIFFPEGNWSFPPESTIITMFPGEFFQGISARIIFFSACEILMLSLALIFWMRFRRKQMCFS
jgi:integral membrane protein (TIGR01906 family)